MRYRVLTVDREFGSGGGRIAETIATWLEWKLLDEAIIEEIAYAAHVDMKVVRQFDEHVDTWLQRLNRRTMRSAVLAAELELRDGVVFNPDEMAKLTEKIIEQGYAEGNCVIVGRGAQCILRHKQDAYHVFVYAARRERILRLRKRLEPSADVEEHLGKMDRERARYVQERFGKCWTDPHLYDLMISSHEDEDLTARVILNAMQGAPVPAPALAQPTQ